MILYNILKHAHSGLRWVVLLLLLAAIIDSFRKMGSKDAPLSKVTLFALIISHVQLIIGLALYFMSPKVAFVASTMKDSVLRFYTVEHLTGMLLAIGVITFGYSTGKRMLPSAAGHRRIAYVYLAGLLVMLASIPWPFRNLGAGWF